MAAACALSPATYAVQYLVIDANRAVRMQDSSDKSNYAASLTFLLSNAPTKIPDRIAASVA